MFDTQRRWLERGGWLAAFLLPLFFNPYALNDPFEPGKTLLFQLIVLGMVVVALWPGGGQDGWWQANPLALPVGVYGVIVGLATAVSIDSRTSFWGTTYRHGAVTTLAAILFFFLITSALRQTQQVEKLISALLIGSVPVAFYGLIQYVGLDPINWAHNSISPIHSTMGRSLYLGSYLAMVIPFTLVRFIQYQSAKQRKKQIAFSMILLLQLSCLLITLARGAWLGFMGGIVLFAVLLAKQRRSWLWGISLLIIAGLIVFGLITGNGWSILGESNIPVQADLSRIRESSDTARITTWRTALTLVPHRWLLGYGPETFATAVQQQIDLTIVKEPAWMYLPDPHNLLLYQVTTVGLAGLAAFLWIIGRFYKLLLAQFSQKNDKDTRLLLAAILSSVTAYLIQAQFNPDMITLSMIFWINLSSGIILLRQEVTTNNNNWAQVN